MAPLPPRAKSKSPKSSKAPKSPKSASSPGTTPLYNPRLLGAVCQEKGGVRFRVWAPFAEAVSVVGEFNGWNPSQHPLERGDDGIWTSPVIAEAAPGQRYQYEIRNGEQVLRKNDPYTQAIDPKDKTSVVVRDDFQWQHSEAKIANWNEWVIYEIHVGTFTSGEAGAPGRLDQVKKRLAYLRHLGINAIELMPVAAFPSERSWGYNLTNPFAVEGDYGGPEALKELIDAAHGQGIAVILDVVYNHFGPDQLDLWRFDGWSENDKGGIYFYNDHRAWTPWGENRPDYGRGEVRHYIRDNALFWLEVFHVDGLRFDATNFIRNTRGDRNPETEIPEGWSLLQWVNEEVERHFPGRITIAEDLQQKQWITKTVGEGGAGFASQWDSAFVHPVRETVVQTADENRSMDAIVRAITFRYNEDAVQRVIYSESHDEVANGKARVPQEISPEHPDDYFARKKSALAAGLVCTVPGIPMLFEGQEFLTDGWFRDDVALDWNRLGSFRGITRLYRDLIHLRRNLSGTTRGLTGPHVRVHHVNHEHKVVAFHRWQDGGPKDDVIVVASFSNQAIEGDYRIGLPHEGEWITRFNSDWKSYSPDFGDLRNPDGRVIAEKSSYDGFDYSGRFTIPPYGLLVMSQESAP
ncbi:maltooligosyl trehalose hydrolase [Verrucomicrobium sp. GAS474]|uniref:alpha-amylase family glycosyl hydrolase n=1 Tax=Verrucomicrobium sp. GAS474 TaxID=1882831 RepID=UPI00087934B0|nr:alpha-amylase family glycosyl hydrolase [Verrucomicrobium sp. GAS474]SDU13234.1 maltooligosyl trehalose hydrolase [Verrucomicrobium sp. GAS474]